MTKLDGENEILGMLFYIKEIEDHINYIRSKMMHLYTDVTYLDERWEDFQKLKESPFIKKINNKYSWCGDDEETGPRFIERNIDKLHKSPKPIGSSSIAIQEALYELRHFLKTIYEIVKTENKEA